MLVVVLIGVDSLLILLALRALGMKEREETAGDE